MNEEQKLAPIVLFAYNRPVHTEKTLNALSGNLLAQDSILYIYCDGPKENESQLVMEKISLVRKIVRKTKWCKEVHIFESDKNKGLADSIVRGVSELIKIYGKVIVLEDDIVTSKGFLTYMNNALDFYANEKKVMHISGYMFPHTKKLPETFFFEVPMCWGWATWERAWKYFNEDAEFLYNYFEKHRKWERFNRFGGKLLQKQLKVNVDGIRKTWFVKWHGSLLINGGISLYPGISLTQNIGFDEEGTNCTTQTEFDINQPAEKISVNEIPLKVSRRATRIIMLFYQGKNYFLRHFIIKMTPDKLKPYIKKIIKI